MASEKITNMIEEIKTLTVLELNELVKALEEEFGKPTRFSEILPEQTKELNAALIKIRDLV